MKNIHVPRIDARYWSAITLASVFGTNLGDFYAHESGFGIWLGVAILLAIAAVAFAVERTDKLTHQFYYWFVIIIIRTGATNIADYLAFRAVDLDDRLCLRGGAGLLEKFQRPSPGRLDLAIWLGRLPGGRRPESWPNSSIV